MRRAVAGPASRVKHPRACREPAATLVQGSVGVIPPVPAVGRDPFASVCDFILHFLSLPRFSTTEPTGRRVGYSLCFRKKSWRAQDAVDDLQSGPKAIPSRP